MGATVKIKQERMYKSNGQLSNNNLQQNYKRYKGTIIKIQPSLHIVTHKGVAPLYYFGI